MTLRVLLKAVFLTGAILDYHGPLVWLLIHTIYLTVSVLDSLQKEIEDRINNQIWDLPRELFRNHIEPARYEVLVDKYRGKDH